MSNQLLKKPCRETFAL